MDRNLPGSSAEISGYVLAGGLSSRLGQDKVLLPWNGQTLLDHAIARLQKLCGTVRVCASRKDLASSHGSSDPPTREIIRDALPGAGPLGGIVAALEHSQTPWNFFLAVDLPLVPVALMQALAAAAETNRSDALCILPQVNGMPQPLCGLYRRSLANGLRVALEEGKYKIAFALSEAVLQVQGQWTSPGQPGLGAGQRPVLGTPASRVELFDVQDFAAPARSDSSLTYSDWFLNVNTAGEWQRACELNSM